ncbi:MAG: hypothetical protein SGBAC_002227 [Bacillariaceae sp.]
MSRKFDSSAASRTKDVLWLSDAILSDLSSCAVLLVINNKRSLDNPFREELKALSDNRWDHGMESRLPDLPSLDTNSSSGSVSTDVSRIKKDSSFLVQSGLTLNFDSLFEAFGRTLHTEVGSLLLYTLLQTSEPFAESLARHSKLSTSSTNGGQNTNDDEEDDLTTPLGRYSEVAHKLLSILSDCLSARRIDQNLQVIYAIVYHQADFAKIFKGDLYPTRQTERILNVAHAASTLIQEASARSAPKALKVLESQAEALKSVVEKKRRKRDSISDFTFTYEEDADPESFFVPYVWEVIVCVVTSSNIEWKKNDIRAFPLLEPEEKTGVQHQPINGVVTSGSFDVNAEECV